LENVDKIFDKKLNSTAYVFLKNQMREEFDSKRASRTEFYLGSKPSTGMKLIQR
jgi:hypothetical protein